MQDAPEPAAQPACDGTVVARRKERAALHSSCPVRGAHLERHCTAAATASCARTRTVARRVAARWPGLALGRALPVAPLTKDAPATQVRPG